MKSFAELNKPTDYNAIPQDSMSSLVNFIKNKGKILLIGPTGSCKTSAVYAIANGLDLEVIEVNASDIRNKEGIERTVGSSANQRSLFSKERIVLIDEIDALSGMEDRGGAQAIASIIKSSSCCIVMTANEKDNEKIKDIKKNSVIIEFKPVGIKHICGILKSICTKSKISFDENSIMKIAISSCGDIRAAINDLQVCTEGNVLCCNSLESRDYKTNINNLLTNIFKLKSIDVMNVSYSTNLNIRELYSWLDENIPYEYQNKTDLFNAYEYLSKSDIFNSRIIKRQYWRFLFYANLLAVAGVSLAKDSSYTNIISYKRSIRPLRIWQSNMKNAKKKSIVLKIAKQTHSSIIHINKNFSYYKEFIKKDNIAKSLELDEEEIAYLNR